MTDNEFLLEDRLQKIRQIINKHGEDAIEFLGYLVEEYDLNDYVRKDNAAD